MNIIRRIFSELSFRFHFRTTPNDFIAKDKLFTLQFPNNWLNSRTGNWFYSFHNEIDDLKGGIQFGLHWTNPIHDNLFTELELRKYINDNEKSEIDCEKLRISKYDALYFINKYEDSNYDFHYWYVYHQNILICITYMIFEEEDLQVKNEWKAQVISIINTLELNLEVFKLKERK